MIADTFGHLEKKINRIILAMYKHNKNIKSQNTKVLIKGVSAH